MQEYGGDKTIDHREGTEGRERGQESLHKNHSYTVIQKHYGSKEGDKTSYGRVTSGGYDSSSQQCQNTRYINSSVPTFSSPPHSPLVGVVFHPSSPNYSRSTMTEHLNPDRRSQSAWSISNQEPIGTGAKKKIVKSHEKRNVCSADPRYHERYKDSSTETEPNRKHDRNLRADSTTSLDFFAEGERMVSELCNIPDPSKGDLNSKNIQKGSQQEDDKKSSGSSETLLTALDKIIIHDQIPIQIVQLAIEACTDAENIAIAHHNRPCFKNIHSICAKTRSNVQKPDSAVANLHSQGIPWVIKNFIFSFVRILDGWKGVKELLSEKHDSFSRIENKYYSPNIRECFVQWQAITKEMLTHIYKTFKCLDQGFTMEQKSFTHNYYATNSAAPRHQNQGKFQPIKTHVSTPRTINTSPQPYNTVQPPWMQSQNQAQIQNFNENPWPSRPNVSYKKFPVVPPPSTQNFYPLNDQSEIDYQKTSYKCDPYNVREAKPRQSWTITNVPDFRNLESMCHTDHRDLYAQLRHKMDAELGKAPGQPIFGAMPCDLMQRRDMELKAKMIPLSHVEKTLIPSMATAADMKNYVQKNNSCGDTKDDTDFFAAWGQMVQKESNDFLTHHNHNIQVPSNVVTLSSNISGPVQFIDNENDEFHEMSKVYMKPGSYKVPIKPADPISSFVQSGSQDIGFDSASTVEDSLKINGQFSPVTLAPQPKYNVESWPCLIPRRADDIFNEEQKLRNMVPPLEMRSIDCLDILNSMTSDRAWEAAKQSAPKLMDFLHDDSKSDTARLYDALGLCTIDEFSNDDKQIHMNFEKNDIWPTNSSFNQYISSGSQLWEQNVLRHDYSQTLFNEDIIKFSETEQKNDFDDNIQNYVNKRNESKEMKCANFDQTGNCVRDDSQKKFTTKSKVGVSGMWYHPKKKKPIPSASVKKFEIIIAKLSTLNEASFIQHDMDIKTAPRFYEVVKYPMCLHDILTKLKNSSYTEIDQVIQDFRRIFNNVKLYLKSYPDTTMKKNVSKVAVEFENLLNEEFPIKMDTKKSLDECDSNKTRDKENDIKNNLEDIKTD
ncbi:unnamed protein product [Pieris macdunnoughi]|uniref:Bromo domain-containing protein n=1 Tax=Pieris macdunnoughi TaxID=345717 RepID=A0A821TQU6_9NEOP|nr:unnamed protein product [Pieris macdunnoughi]